MSRDSKNDLLEEFQFKPLTDGLGFHKKTVDLKSEVAASGLSDDTKTHFIPESPDDLLDDPLLPTDSGLAELTTPEWRTKKAEGGERNSTDRSFLKPLNGGGSLTDENRPLLRRELTRNELTRKEELERGALRGVRSKEESALNRVNEKLNLNFVEPETGISKEILKQKPERPRYKTLKTNMTAAVFDAVVVLTLTILFLVAMISITKVDLVALIFNDRTQLTVQGGLIVMYLSILQLYMVMSRLIGGSTLGEWAFDVYLAEKDHRMSLSFIFRILTRSMLSMATGFIVLPLLSLIFRKDIAGQLTGTRLYQQY